MLPVKDERLFLKYAIPCGSVLVKRGKISQEELDRMRQDLIENRPIKKDPGKIFRAAGKMCAITAVKMGKKSIDQEVIRRYFWREHNRFVDWRVSVYQDFDPEACKIRPARILESGEKIIVRTPEGKKEAKETFCPVKKGEWVILHYSSIIEKISEKQARSLWYE